MDSLKIGIIGAGIIAHNHISAAENMPEVKLHCIADIIFQKAKELGDKHNLKPYADYREMLDKEKLDAVIITLPVFLHCEAAIEAASRGIHVMVEKPMAASNEECRLMISAAKLNNVKLMIGHMQRYIPANMRVSQLLEAGTLGQLIMINEKRYYNYFNDSRPKWCLKKETAGGGVMLNLGAHSVDKALFLSKSHIRNVAGKIGDLAEGTDIEGNGQFFLEMENGVSAVSTQNGYSKISEILTEYIFKDGTVNMTSNSHIVIRSGERIWEEDVKGEDPFVAQLKVFINSISGNGEISTTGEYGLEIVKAITSLY